VLDLSEDELIRDVRTGMESGLAERSARAVVEQAGTLLDQGSGDRALELLDALIAALDGSADLERRKALALALATKSAALRGLGRRHAMRPFELMVSQYGDEAVDEFDEEVTRLWSADTPHDRERLAWLLLTEAMTLECEGRLLDAEDTLETMLKRFDGETSPTISQKLDAARHALEMYNNLRHHI
jgi:hypothetical protein